MLEDLLDRSFATLVNDVAWREAMGVAPLREPYEAVTDAVTRGTPIDAALSRVLASLIERYADDVHHARDIVDGVAAQRAANPESNGKLMELCTALNMVVGLPRGGLAAAMERRPHADEHIATLATLEREAGEVRDRAYEQAGHIFGHAVNVKVEEYRASANSRPHAPARPLLAPVIELRTRSPR